MTDNEIIKALECHACTGIETCELCPLLNVEGCAYKLAQGSLNLINRQKAEIERLNGENKAFGEIIKKQDDEISVLRKDLLKREDLEKSFSKTVKQFDKKLAKTVKLERAEAVKEFAERLKGKLHLNGVAMGSNCAIVEDTDIDNLVKELVGEG